VVMSKSPSCPICKNIVFPKFSVPCDYRKPNHSKDYEVYWCPDCDYGMVWGRPSKEEVNDFYALDDYYTHNADNAETNKEALSFLDRMRIHISYRLDRGEDLEPSEVTSLLKENKPKICEIGCGNGGNLAKFQAEGYSVFGVEPDPSAREVAKKVTPNIFNGTAEELPETIKNEKYDIVLMSHVLEHCLDVNTVISNVKAILKDDGIYIVETPNCKALGFKTYQGAWPWSDIPRHLNFFTPESIDKILKKHGFQVNLVKYSGFCRQFSNNWLKDEREIWSAFSQHSAMEQETPNFQIRAWKLLLSSLFTSNASKYDSVRFIGIKEALP